MIGLQDLERPPDRGENPLYTLIRLPERVGEP